jgi:hypothetical protein
MKQFQTWWAFLSAALVLLLLPAHALAQDDPRAFADTGFSIADDAIWSFFDQNGGAASFGSPISREFSLPGSDNQVQLFQNAALQVQPDGNVQPLPLATDAFLPYTSFGGLSVPPADPAIGFVAPTPDQPNYPARLAVYLQGTIPEPFWSAFNALGGASVWGLPTSTPKADPNNPHFIYQRFSNGIFLNDADAGTTTPLPLGQYLKATLQGQGLPADLNSEAARSPLYGKLANSVAFAPDLAQ